MSQADEKEGVPCEEGWQGRLFLAWLVTMGATRPQDLSGISVLMFSST